MNKKNILLTLGITIIILSVIGISYAYFTATVDNSSAKKNTFKSGKMELTYADGSGVISSSNMTTGQSITKEFTVEKVPHIFFLIRLPKIMKENSVRECTNLIICGPVAVQE